MYDFDESNYSHQYHELQFRFIPGRGTEIATALFNDVTTYCNARDQVKLRNRNLVTCTLFSLLWYEIKDVPIYRCKSFKFRTLGVKFRYIYCS